MSTEAHPGAPTAVRRARLAVATFFLVNGVLFANLVPRFPEVRGQLDLSNGALGAAIAAMPAGALLAGLFAPAVIRRLGSATTATGGLVLLGVVIALVPHTGGWAGLAVVLFVAGALDAVVDVSMNAHGFRVQRRYGRSIVNAFHGFWSVGSVLGGLLGSVAVGVGVALPTHLAASGIVFGGLAVVARAFALPGPEDAEREIADVPASPHAPPAHAPAPEVSPEPSAARRAVRPAVLLAALGLLAACASMVEDAAASWSAIYLRDDLAAASAVAGLAFVCLQTAMTLGRLFGDRIVDRFGQRRVARSGGAIVAVSFGAMVLLPSVPMTLVAFALAGLGVATVVPAAMHAGDELEGVRLGVGLAVVSWSLRVGFLVSAPLIGALADVVGLRLAMLVVVAAGIGVNVLGRVLGPDPRRRRA